MNRKQYYSNLLSEFQSKKNLTTKQKKELYQFHTKNISTLFNEGSGVFAESLCKEEIKSCGYNLIKKGILVENLPEHIKKENYIPDGLIEELDLYIESKNYMFYSTGTANEKLPGFLIKLQYYDKPCLLIFSGQHEVRQFDECNIILGSYNEEPEFENEFLYPIILKFKKQKKLYVCGFSNLKQTLDKIKLDRLW